MLIERRCYDWVSTNWIEINVGSVDKRLLATLPISPDIGERDANQSIRQHCCAPWNQISVARSERGNRRCRSYSLPSQRPWHPGPEGMLRVGSIQRATIVVEVFPDSTGGNGPPRPSTLGYVAKMTGVLPPCSNKARI